MEEDPCRKIFEVGDVIKPNIKWEKLFSGTYKYEAPLTVTKVYLNEGGDQWLLHMSDANGKRGDVGWYHYRFEPVYKGYDPEQTGDTDEDV